MFTQEILSPGTINRQSATPLSGSVSNLDTDGEWDEVDPIELQFSATVVQLKGQSQLIGNFWKERTMELHEDIITFSKAGTKSVTVKLSLNLEVCSAVQTNISRALYRNSLSQMSTHCHAGAREDNFAV